MDDDKVFGLYCISDCEEPPDYIRDDERVQFMGKVTNEIDAVAVFKNHIKSFGQDHVRFIYMCPYPDKPALTLGELKAWAPNMFRPHVTHLVSSVDK